MRAAIVTGSCGIFACVLAGQMALAAVGKPGRSTAGEASAARPPAAAEAPAVKPPSKGEISQQALVKLGQRALVYRRKDDFSPAFDDSAAIDKTFRAVIPIPRGSNPRLADLDTGWVYDADSKELTVTIQAGLWKTPPKLMLTSTDYTLAGYRLALIVKHEGKGLEQNAFGATAQVSYGSLKSIGIAAISADAQAASVPFAEDSLTSKRPMEPEHARKLVKALVAVIEGRIVAMANGHAVVCGSDGTAATLTMRTSVQERYCLFNAVIDRVSFQSGGETLAEFKPVPAPR